MTDTDVETTDCDIEENIIDRIGSTLSGHLVESKKNMIHHIP